ncbi:IS5 family transposase [Sinorhizobium sp. 8-89]|uniref:IS5 family transposase n=1 Tax=Sinorhizobium sp. 7-81 TaxID=3049087 RepID=UPI0024C23396|nr:IS5 family transposase [Sinorhizobium sp. 7-81]MDK1389457.1 IS5 family transposase [Sinorhizobium sp. 7-81]
MNDQQWTAIEPLLPKNRPGARRVDDRRVIGGIVHVLRVGCRWQDCPAVYGPPTTICNRFHRWAGRGLWQKLFNALVETSRCDMQMIDSTPAKLHRSAAGGKGGGANAGIGRSRGGRRRKSTPSWDGRGRPLGLQISPGQLGDVRAAMPLLQQLQPAYFLAADTAYDSHALRQFLAVRGTIAVIPQQPHTQAQTPFDPRAYRSRNIIERMFCRLKDWRRVATRYDKLATNFQAAILIAAIVIWWTD